MSTNNIFLWRNKKNISSFLQKQCPIWGYGYNHPSTIFVMSGYVILDILLFAKSEDTDQMLHFAVSDLGLHCLLITHLEILRLKWVKG